MKKLRAWQDRLAPRQGKLAWTAAAALVSGLVWAVLCRQVEEQSAGAALAALAESDAGLWFTGLFLALPVLALALVLRSLLAGNLIVGGAALLLSFINYYKMRITSTPLTLGDFALAGQVGNIAAINRDSLSLSAVSALTLAEAAVWLLWAWFLSRPLRTGWRRGLAGAGAAVLAFCLLFWAGADAALYRPLGLDLAQTRPQAAVNLTCGTPLGLWRALLSQGRRTVPAGPETPPDLSDLLDGPETPAPTEPAGTETPAPTEPAQTDPPGGETPAPTEPAQTDPPRSEVTAEHPNVILILSESFFDVTRLEGVAYAEDPVPEFRALKQEGVSGTFYSRSLGYGTSNIELEIFTGLNTGLLAGENLYSSPPETFSRVPALPGLLGRNGYYTAMVHMFNDSIYHRQSLFQYLGFDNLYFSGNFADFYPPAAEAEDYWTYMRTRISGGAYSDDLMSDGLIALYEKMSAKHDGPLFLYGSSMEGHQPYSADKYGADELTVSFTSPLTGEAADALRIFSQCVRNASAALGKLTDYFRTCPEPTVIVFFGDHRPGLGLADGGTVYSELGLVPDNIWKGSCEDFREVYSTDYLIWANDPDLLPGAPGSTWDTSCSYLGARVLELAGVELPAYWQLVARLGQTRTADALEFHLDRAGNLSDGIAEDDPDAQRLAALRSIISGVLAGTGTAPE